MANEIYWHALSTGNFRGRRRVVMSAFAPDVDVADVPMGVHPNPVKGLYPAQAAAVALEVVSSSAADAFPAGTGARQVTIKALDDSFNEVADVVVNLNGVTPVALPGGAIYRRVNRMDVTSVGSGEVAAGNITLRVPGPGAWQRYIPAGEAADRVGFLTVPANKWMILHSASFEVERSAADTVRIHLLAREASVPGPLTIEREFGFSGVITNDYELRGNRLLGPRDLLLRVVAATGANQRIVGRVFEATEDF